MGLYMGRGGSLALGAPGLGADGSEGREEAMSGCAGRERGHLLTRLGVALLGGGRQGQTGDRVVLLTLDMRDGGEPL